MKSIFIALIIAASLSILAKGGEGGGTGVTPVKAEAFLKEKLIESNLSEKKLSVVFIEKDVLKVENNSNEIILKSHIKYKTEIVNFLYENTSLDNDSINALDSIRGGSDIDTALVFENQI